MNILKAREPLNCLAKFRSRNQQQLTCSAAQLSAPLLVAIATCDFFTPIFIAYKSTAVQNAFKLKLTFLKWAGKLRIFLSNKTAEDSCNSRTLFIAQTSENCIRSCFWKVNFDKTKWPVFYKDNFWSCFYQSWPRFFMIFGLSEPNFWHFHQFIFMFFCFFRIFLAEKIKKLFKIHEKLKKFCS